MIACGTKVGGMGAYDITAGGVRAHAAGARAAARAGARAGVGMKARGHCRNEGRIDDN